MNTQAATIPNDPGRDERAMRTCQDLAELGMALVREAADEARRAIHRTGPAAGAPVEAVERFVRCSRGVRRAILLESRIDDGGYELRSPSHPGEGNSDCSLGDMLEEEDDLAGDECRSVPEILAEIQAELGLTTLGGAVDHRQAVSSRMLLRSSSAIMAAPDHRASDLTGAAVFSTSYRFTSFYIS